MFLKLKQKFVALFANRDKRNYFLRVLTLGLLVGVVVALLGVNFAHAGFSSCLPVPGYFSMATCVSNIFYVIIYIISFIAGFFIAVALWLIEVMLQFNMTVVNTSIVQSGYSITLGIANLGFVLGIIIVALATILRRETYGIKSILWKIVVMAIFVNFALVIAAPILNFANGLTMYFVNALPGGTNSTTGSGGGGAFKGFDNLSSGIAGIFQPQRLVTPENASTTFSQAVNGATQSVAGAFGTTLAGFAGLVMSVITLGLMLVVLIVFFVLLLIRYVYLVVLLIVAPLAWMSWVFPKTSKYWSQWWDKFIAQAFFPVFVMFFMYLIITTGSTISPGNNVSITPVSNSWISGFFQAIGNGLMGPVVGTVLSGLIMIGLMMAGLTMGTKMATEGSALAAKVVGQVKDSVQGYATKQGKKGARAISRKTGITGAVGRARSGELGQGLRGKKLMGIPGTGFLGTAASKVLQSGAAKRVASVTGRALEPQLSNKEYVEAAKKGVPDNIKQIKENLKTSMSKEDQLAHIAKLVEKKALDKDVEVNGVKIAEFLDKNKDAFASYGQGTLDIDKALLSNEEMRAAEIPLNQAKAALDRAVESGDEEAVSSAKVVYESATTAYENVAAAFVKTLEKADVAKMNINAIFKDRTPASDATLKAVFENNDALLSSMLGKANGNTKNSMDETYRRVIEPSITNAIRAETQAVIPPQVQLANQERDNAINAIPAAIEIVRREREVALAQRESDFEKEKTAFEMAERKLEEDKTAGRITEARFTIDNQKNILKFSALTQKEESLKKERQNFGADIEKETAARTQAVQDAAKKKLEEISKQEAEIETRIRKKRGADKWDKLIAVNAMSPGAEETPAATPPPATPPPPPRTT